MGIFSSPDPAPAPPPPPPVPPAAHPATMASGEVQKAAASSRQRAAAAAGLKDSDKSGGSMTGGVPNAKAKLLGDTA